MSTRIEINPNLRVDGGQYTVADLDEDVRGSVPGVLEAVEVFESTSGMRGRGWVSEVDEVERTVTLLVDWGSLRLDPLPNLSESGRRGGVVNAFAAYRTGQSNLNAFRTEVGIRGRLVK